jgi:uncharacterized membrane protein YhfC
MNTTKILTGVAIAAGVVLLLLVGLRQPETVIPALNPFLMIGLGLGLGFFLHHRYDLPWGVYAAGALTFILSQVGHIPFNLAVLNPLIARIVPDIAAGSRGLLLAAGLLGLSAGVFEETARYLVLRFWRRDIRSWRLAVMYGAGHGGIEAVLVGIVAFYAFLQLVLFHRFDPAAISGISDQAQLETLQAVVYSFWGAEWYQQLLGAFERLSVLPIHLAAAVMVFRSVTNRQPMWYLAAVAWHTLVNLLAVYGSQTWGILPTEGGLFLLGLLGVAIVFLLKGLHPPPDDLKPLEVPVGEAPVPPKPVEDITPITIEELDESRYD